MQKLGWVMRGETWESNKAKIILRIFPEPPMFDPPEYDLPMLNRGIQRLSIDTDDNE